MHIWNWIWPHVSGATPINQGLDSEMFDRSDYPYSETFVREAVQNSLDARLDTTKPVCINFSFHQCPLAEQKPFLAAVIQFRKAANLPDVPEWSDEIAKWLVVEDFNSKGLGGDLEDRSSDFCNYWLNFGLSNKDGTQRGGRGIGRVTFLIASKLQTVIGYTRRDVDGIIAVCGMSVLRAQPDGKKFRSTHAYLAQDEQDSVLKLHDNNIHEALREGFRITGYNQEHKSGLALAIPYPHEELDGPSILAAAIEHFAPAIMSGALVVTVDGTRLDKDTISVIAARISHRFNAEALRKDAAGYLHLIQAGYQPNPVLLRANGGTITLENNNSDDMAKKLQSRLQAGETVVVQIKLPLERERKSFDVSLSAVVRKTPDNGVPIDRLFREGMSLPDVRAKNPAELDVVILVHDGDLATYLNFCEGKAHLDLLKSKETKTKLEAKGYTGSVLRVRNFVKELPHKLRQLLTPDVTEADASVFEGFFSVPSDEPGNVRRPKGDKRAAQPPAPPPPKKPPPVIVESMPDGLRVKANPMFTDWPANISITVAYADGSKRPDWSEFDFKLSELPIETEDCEVAVQDNRLRATNCGPKTRVQITGFDTRRELDTRIRAWTDAQTN